MNSEEEMVDLSWDECEHWCEVRVCVLASVLSLVNVACDVDLSSVSVSDCEIVESQVLSLSLSRKRDASVAFGV